jgi:NIMA (never in mitosis gene a)-related kinase
LETEEIMPIFIQLAQCLDHLHSKHVLHRDLKTKNIFLTQDDSVKLGDFGLSKILGSQHDMAHSAVGTPYYLSPELCEGRPYDYKSDVWALGCVTYEMTTLRYVRSCRQVAPRVTHTASLVPVM